MLSARLTSLAHAAATQAQVQEIVELLTVAAARPSWRQAASEVDLSSLEAVSVPDVLLADLVGWMQALGHSDAARRMVEERIEATGPPESEDEREIFSAGRGNVLFRLVASPAGWQLAMTSPMLETAAPSEDEWVPLLSSEPDMSQRPAVPPPEDWVAFAERSHLEGEAARSLLEALHSSEPGAPSSSRVDVLLKEQWKAFQQKIIEASEGLPVPPAVEQMRQACSKKDRTWFKPISWPGWSSEQGREATEPLRARAEIEQVALLRQLDEKLPAFLLDEFTKRGSALDSLQDELLRVTQGLAAELMKSRQQAERLRDRAGEVVGTSVTAIQKAAASLLGAFQKPPFEEASEQVDLWMLRLREAEMTRLVEGFLHETQGRLHEALHTYSQIIRVREARVNDLAMGTLRVRTELASVFADPTALAPPVALVPGRKQALLEMIHSMPEGAEPAALPPWFDSVCKRVREWSEAKGASGRTP